MTTMVNSFSNVREHFMPRLIVRCVGARKDGAACRHVVARVPRDEIEGALNVEVECGRCGKVATLREFVYDSQQ